MYCKMYEIEKRQKDSAVGDLITQQISTYIDTVPSVCGYNFLCNLN